MPGGCACVTCCCTKDESAFALPSLLGHPFFVYFHAHHDILCVRKPYESVSAVTSQLLVALLRVHSEAEPVHTGLPLSRTLPWLQISRECKYCQDFGSCKAVTLFKMLYLPYN
ncbi:mCG1040417 [Mus musculus]|nr:mCG1040417 [Mus musculus]